MNISTWGGRPRYQEGVVLCAAFFMLLGGVNVYKTYKNPQKKKYRVFNQDYGCKGLSGTILHEFPFTHYEWDLHQSFNAIQDQTKGPKPQTSNVFMDPAILCLAYLHIKNVPPHQFESMEIEGWTSFSTEVNKVQILRFKSPPSPNTVWLTTWLTLYGFIWRY